MSGGKEPENGDFNGEDEPSEKGVQEVGDIVDSNIRRRLEDRLRREAVTKKYSRR